MIKNYLGFKNDYEFAYFLGIKPNTLSSWHSRNTFNRDLIISKCEFINIEWLMTGSGDMLKRTPETEHNNPDITPSPLDDIFKNKGDLILQMAEEIGSLKEQIRNLKKQLGYTNNKLAAEE